MLSGISLKLVNKLNRQVISMNEMKINKDVGRSLEEIEKSILNLLNLK